MSNELPKLLARVTALKEVKFNGALTPEIYAREFNSILDGLESVSNEKLDEFRIPESEIKRRVTSISMMGGGRTYSDQKFCDGEYLLMKVNGILSFFTFILQPTEVKNKLGFQPEEK